MNSRASSILLGAVLTVSLAASLKAQILFSDNFDSFGSPSTITSSQTANGYKIVYADAGLGAHPESFTAIFGFDYSTVTYPVPIPSAPNSVGGTTKGLYLTVNKDPAGHPFGANSGVAPGTNAAVNLYPVGQSFSGDYSLKFDVWINWTNLNFSTEHAMFGINHSGNMTNRITGSGSDGLFSAMDGDGGVSATSTGSRDFSMFQGRGAGLSPLLLRTNTFTFGPGPLLGNQFDNADPGFAGLFPSKPIYGGTPAGSAGLGWVSGEYRQQGNIVSWYLNSILVGQYTNTTAFTSGDIMVGYDDTFNSLGDTNDFAIFDNIVVSAIPEPSVATLVLLACGTTAWFARRRKN